MISWQNFEREVKRLGSALARHTWQSEREAICHLWRRQGILLQRGNLEILENQEPAFPGPVIDGIIVNNRVIEVYFVKVSLRECLNALLKQDQQRGSQAGTTDTRTYGILYSKSLILKLDNSWLYPFPSD